MSGVLVYKITCRVNGKVYIGITVKSVDLRWRAHCRAARSGRNVGSLLQAAILKYGDAAFEVETLMACATWEQACVAERELIEEFDCFINGYNATKGGEGTLGFKPSKETRALLSKLRRGRPKSEAHKSAISAAKKGVHVKPEHIHKCGNAWRGKKQPEEMIEKRMEKIRGVPLSEEHRKKIGATRVGRPLTEAEKAFRETPEYKEKMRQASLKRWAKVRALEREVSP